MMDDPVHVDSVMEREEKEAFNAVARKNKLSMSEAVRRFALRAIKTGKIPN